MTLTARGDAPHDRTILQLTSGADFCYPLYYFAPSITADNRFMVYHRQTPGAVHEIQLHRLDLATGESVVLARGTSEGAHWQPWGVDPARGILGDRSALAVQRGEVIYFDGRRARAVDLSTLAHRDLFDVPEDRFTLAQNCVTGDDRWFVYVHVDRRAYERLLAMREAGGKIVPHVPTAQGIAYEVNFRPDGAWAGLMDPHTGRRREWPVLPGTNHTGVDPAGTLFFYQVGADRIEVMRRFDAGGDHDWQDLFGAWPSYGRGQKAHFHPRLVLGRRWMQLVAGDPRTGTNHIFLVDVGDLVQG